MDEPRVTMTFYLKSPPSAVVLRGVPWDEATEIKDSLKRTPDGTISSDSDSPKETSIYFKTDVVMFLVVEPEHKEVDS